jgi:hypothetical protein
MTVLPNEDPVTRLFLRHALATLAYRAGKTVRGTPAAFAAYRSAPGSPSPNEILAHMSDLMDWALTMAKGVPKWTSATPLPWKDEIDRFFTSIQRFDDYLESGLPIAWDPGRIFQGGIADALTHTGQLAMLRRLSGHKMKGENYSKAQISVGKVSADQAPPDPANEFD